jgi:23S rRNA pseudouridine1911/1915/1917 synthase
VRPVTPEQAAAMPLSRRKTLAWDRAAGDQDPYRTEISDASEITERNRAETTALKGGQRHWRFHIRILRGFRHQIRCHLAWAGLPIVNDPVYGPPPPAETDANFMELNAVSISFRDSDSGKDLTVSV